jgi:ferredoxin
VSACPVDAIFFEANVPPEQKEFVAINARYAHLWPVILEKKPAMPDADYWHGRPGRRALLDPGPAAAACMD